jgi:hypothetical protein
MVYFLTNLIKVKNKYSIPLVSKIDKQHKKLLKVAITKLIKYLKRYENANLSILESVSGRNFEKKVQDFLLFIFARRIRFF